MKTYKFFTHNNTKTIISYKLVCSSKKNILIKETSILVIIDQYIKKYFFYYIKKKFFYTNKIHVISLSSKEQNKSFNTIKNIIYILEKNNYTKHDTIVAIGGGIILDISGLCASIFKRGMQLIYIPTSLVAQIDVSIGGKNGINGKFTKNILGSIYFPKKILIDSYFLHSISKKDFFLSLSEIIKISLIEDKNFFYWIFKNIYFIKNRNISILHKLIYKSIILKNIIVKKDILEKNKRLLLNFGHTFGHAIERSTYYYVTHSYAILLGMIISISISRLNSYEKNLIFKLFKIVYKELDIEIPKIKKNIISFMKNDKKITKKNFYKIIMLKKIGKGKIINIEKNILFNNFIKYFYDKKETIFNKIF